MKKQRALCWLLVFTLLWGNFLQPISVYATETQQEKAGNSEVIGARGIEYNIFEGEEFDKEASKAYHEELLKQQSGNGLYADTYYEFSSIEEAVNFARKWAVERQEGWLTFDIVTEEEVYFPTDLEFLALIREDWEGCGSQEGDFLRYSSKSTSYYYAGGYTGTEEFYGFSFEFRTNAAQEAQLTEKVDAIMEELDIDDASEFDKIHAIYNYICDNVNYDYSYTQYTAWDALCTGTSVCQGYAVAFYRLAKEADLSVRIISGIGNGGPHAWNIVRLGSVYYNMDTTWDGQDDQTRANYYLKNMADFDDHYRDAEYETAEFHAKFPMAKDSWVDTSEFEAPLEISNPEYIFEALDGSTISTKAEGRPKLLLFFNDGCYYSQTTISNIANSDISGVDIMAFEADGTTPEAMQNFIETYGRSDMVFSSDSLAYQAMWQYARTGGFGSRITYPVMVYIDSDNIIQAVTIGLQDASTIKVYLKYYCGIEEIVLSIIGQPTSKTVVEGENAVFRVTASGKNLSYQWQYKSENGDTWYDSNAEGAKTDSLIVVGTSEINGRKYRCVINDSTGNTLVSNEVTLTVKVELQIINHPESVTVTEGEDAIFSVAAKGENVSYQWQYSADGSSWKNSGMSGATTASLTVTGLAERNGQQYRCVVTDGEGNQQISLAAKLTVKVRLEIETQPVSKTVYEGETAVFSVKAKGEGLSYQWQYSTDGNSWSDSGMPGATTESLTVEALAERNGQMYRCVVTDADGNQQTSNAVKLSVKTRLAIESQPVSKTVYEGETAIFTVKVKGDGLSYQWQYSADGKSWTDSGMTGAKTASLTVEGTKARDGQQYRCVVTDKYRTKLTSNAAKLSVRTRLVIETQPVSKTVYEDETAVFSVRATGDGLSYQWQYSADGKTWNNSGMTGAKTASLTVEGTIARDGQMYRCVVTDKYGDQQTSNTAKLSVRTRLVIETHPVSKTVYEGDKAVFTVKAAGDGLSYQWQYSTDGKTWNDSGMTGSTTASLTIEALAKRDGQHYRCVVKDKYGNKQTSNAAKLSVRTRLVIETQPVSKIVYEGEKAVFIVAATGDGLSYQWQYSADGKTWTDSGMTGSTTTSLTVEALAKRDGQVYRCVVTDKYGNQKTSNVAKLSVKTRLVIEIHPVSKTVYEGQEAIFNVKATGDGLKYQWQYSADGKSWMDSGMTGSTTASLTVEGLKKRDGQMYRCVVTDKYGDKQTSNAAKLTVKIKLVIETQPVSKTVYEGEKAVFSVKATGDGVKYQWQYSTDGKTWIDSGMTGSTTASLTVEGLKKRDGQQYRCVVTDKDGNKLTSNAAKLTVKIKLVIETQPVSQTVYEGENVVFSVKATGDGVKYQWQYSTDGKTWTDSGMTGSTTASLTVEALEKRDGQLYRCVVTDKDGNQLTSSAAKLIVKIKLAIETQPVSKTVYEGDKAVFSVKARGESLSYQWQYSADGKTWSVSGMTGSTTASLTVEGLAKRNGQQYRCVVTDKDGNQQISSVAKLTVRTRLVIETQPVSQAVYDGEKVVFSVKAKGDSVSYQWQYSADGKTWSNSGMTGSTTTSLTVEGLVKRDGQQYRCVVTDKYGNQKTSNAAKLTIKTRLSIETQPVSKTVYEGENAVFTVKAKGEGLSYQWQYSADGKTWSNSGMTGSTTASLTVEGLVKRDSQQYRCVVTDADGNQKISNAAKLTVKIKLAIETQPVSQTISEGKTAVFSVKAKGESLNYQWQFSKDSGKTWNASGMTGAKTANLTVVGTIARSGQQYRCVITDADGKTVTSMVATLTVKPAVALAIVTNPSSKTVEEGTSAIFKVVAQGEGLTYQWQFSKDEGKTWNNSGMTGAKTASLTVEGTMARSGQQYRCVVTDEDGKTATSKAATLTVKPAPVALAIITNPSNQIVEEGTNAVFTVVAQGEGLTYQWQFKSASAIEWKNSGMIGSKTASLSVVGTEARSGQQYRCVVTDKTGNTVTSKAATLTVKVKFAIVTNPLNQTVKVGETATFTVAAQGEGLTYQWQFKSASATDWSNSGMTGAKTASLSVVGTEARNGQQYRCVITDGSGQQVISEPASLIVE